MDLPFKTLLVSTDFSPLGNAALPLAFRLAKDHGARLTLATVLEVPPSPNPMYAHYYPIPTPEQKDKARTDAHAALKALASGPMAAGVAWDAVVLEGEPAAELADWATKHTVSALVIASHGRTGLKKLILGSVAERVLRQTTCPIVLVR